MNKTIKIFSSVFLLAIVIIASVPKIYVHSLLGHNHHQTHSSKGLDFSENHETQDCSFEKFDTPVTYTIHNFNISFLVFVKHQTRISQFNNTTVLATHYNNSFLRGPPVA